MNEWDILAKRLNAEREQQEAAQRLAALQNTQQQNERPGGIAGVLAGIGESIGNFGDTLYNMGGTGIASIRDLVTGNAGTGKYQNEWKQYRKEQAGNPEMSDKDYYLKTGAKALDAAATASDFIPGLGTGAKVALNVGQGVVSGGARELIDNGENANLNNVLIGAAAGGLGSAAGQAVGGKLAKNAISNPAKSAIGKAAQSAIGRGAITGAVSGAVGGGVGSTLAGGNTLEGALQGASSGALGGATTAALYDIAGAGINKIKNKIENGPASVKAASPIEPTTKSALSEGSKAEAYAKAETLAGEKARAYMQEFGISSDNQWNEIYEKAYIDAGKELGLTKAEINEGLNAHHNPSRSTQGDIDYVKKTASDRAKSDVTAEYKDLEAKSKKINAEINDILQKRSSAQSIEEVEAIDNKYAQLNRQRSSISQRLYDLRNGKQKYSIDFGNEIEDAAPIQPSTPKDGDKPMTEGQRRRTTPTGWNDEDLTGEAKKQNYLQKLGGDLQDAAQATRDSAIYSKLKGNTADEMVAKDAIGNLRKNYGYSPDDYEQAGKLSTAINKWYDNEIQSSGAEKINTKLSSDLALPDNNTLPEKYEKAYNATLKNAMNMANAGDSNVIDKYTASGLERAAKYLGEQEQKMRRTNMNGVGGRPDGDRAELADYYKNARQILRNEVNSMIELDDITKNNLSKLLDNAGATEQAKKAILSAKTFSEVKSATAPLEDARTMYRQMKSSGLKRSAAGDNSASLGTQVATKTGAGNLLDVGLKPVRTGVAAAENVAGKAISAVGDAIAGDANGVPGKMVGGIANVARTAATAPNLNIGPIDMDTIVNRQIARQSAVNAGNAPLANQRAAAASQALSEAQTAYNTANANLAAAQNAASPAISNGAQQLTTIKNAMQLALNAGDLASYQKLSDLYSEAYKIYGEELQQTNPMSQLTSSQIENINKLDTAGNAIDELEALFQKAGGGQGLVGGNAANFMAALGLNSDVSTYNALSRGLVNQIGAAIGKTDSLNTEGEVNRALELIPKFTDDAQTAQNKLEQLRQMLATNKQTVYANYGLTQ